MTDLPTTHCPSCVEDADEAALEATGEGHCRNDDCPVQFFDPRVETSDKDSTAERPHVIHLIIDAWKDEGEDPVVRVQNYENRELADEEAEICRDVHCELDAEDDEFEYEWWHVERYDLWVYGFDRFSLVDEDRYATCAEEIADNVGEGFAKLLFGEYAGDGV